MKKRYSKDGKLEFEEYYKDGIRISSREYDGNEKLKIEKYYIDREVLYR